MDEKKAHKGNGYTANGKAGIGACGSGGSLSLLQNASSGNRAGGPGAGQVSVVSVFSEGKGPGR